MTTACRERRGSRAARSCGLISLLVCIAGATPVGAQPVQVSAGLGEQIRALDEEKASRSPAERKISSHLLYADRMRRGVPIARGITTLRSLVEIDADGTTEVDIRADLTARLVQRIADLGGASIYASPRRRALRARLPVAALENLAELAEVDSISPADRAFTRKIDTSEGDAAHRADQLRTSLGADGTGVSVGVLSDGVGSLASLQSSGDLPPTVTVLSGQAGSGSEGTAMLEIIFDLAPGADLLFATAFTSQASFADNILALRAAGADVIVDDVGYFAEGVFQDDDVADAVNAVTAAGALYFSAAGNAGNLNDGTSGVWEGDFNAATSPIGATNAANEFAGGDIYNEITTASPSVYTLHWADPLGGSANDYDLYLVNKGESVIFAASTTVQSGNDDPFEIIGAAHNDKGRKLLVVRKSADSTRFMHLNANRGRLEYATSGQTSGHSAARDAFSVSAVDVATATGPFDGSESVETFSSDGPRRVFYEANGTAITPGAFDSSGGEVRGKPDLTAADCVSTATPGFATFCGTSAAAPHAAAVAALLLDIDGSADATQIRYALTGTALDIEWVGVDRDSGAGIVDALAAGDALDDCFDDADCDDGAFCNGVETCSAGACMPGTAVDPDDGIACTTDACDEATNGVVNTPLDADCDNGLFCDGAETCDALLGCQSGVAIDPDDAIACTADSCDETTDTVINTPLDANCDNGLYCDGSETCDGPLGCQSGLAIDPDDGVSCTEDVCDEAEDLIVNSPDDIACDDGDPCTADTCDAISGCGHAPVEGCSGAPVPAISGRGRLLIVLLLPILAALFRRGRSANG